MPRFPAPTRKASLILFQPKNVSMDRINSETEYPVFGLPMIPVYCRSLRTCTGTQFQIPADHAAGDPGDSLGFKFHQIMVVLWQTAQARLPNRRRHPAVWEATDSINSYR